MGYLHEGLWEGRRILSKEFIREATRPTDRPAPFSYYGFYWGTNAKGTYPEIPKDTFWALGLGDSFVTVCPSLDIVAVRLGVGSKKSELLGGESDDWGKRVAGFFRLVAAAVTDVRPPNQTHLGSTPPYPPSRIIKEILWTPKERIIRQARGSDNWPITWADDDCLYTAYGDGNGFDPGVPKKLSLGLARIEGGPEEFRGINIRSESGEQIGNGARGKKASGMLMVNGVLYMWVRNADNAQLAWSIDHARTWTWADWKLTTSFGGPTFLNYGRNYAGARDAYVYVYSHDHDSAYRAADRMVLARVP